jgi:hypothetical protein
MITFCVHMLLPMMRRKEISMHKNFNTAAMRFIFVAGLATAFYSDAMNLAERNGTRVSYHDEGENEYYMYNKAKVYHTKGTDTYWTENLDDPWPASHLFEELKGTHEAQDVQYRANFNPVRLLAINSSCARSTSTQE